MIIKEVGAMKKDIPCKTCKKLTSHISRYCLDHRHAWREGYKAGVQLRETATYMPDDALIKALEEHATYPFIVFHKYHLLFLRAAKLIRKLKKEQK
jgi:hypothetical protein